MELELKGVALKRERLHRKRETLQQRRGRTKESETETETEILKNQKERIQKRRNVQMKEFLARQTLARERDTSEHASSLKYESKFEKWKEQQAMKVQPPSIFATGIGSDKTSHQTTKRRPTRPASASIGRRNRKERQEKSVARLSPARPTRPARPARPQSAHPASHGGRRGRGSTAVSFSTLNITPRTKEVTNGLIRTMCKPMIHLFNSSKKDDHHRRSKIINSMGDTVRLSSGSGVQSSSIAAASPSSPSNGTMRVVYTGTDVRAADDKQQTPQKFTNDEMISSYLKPLQYEDEDDYTPWRPRIKQLTSTRTYGKPKDTVPVRSDGGVPHVHSPGKPPPDNAPKDVKAQYIYNLQQYIVQQAAKTKRVKKNKKNYNKKRRDHEKNNDRNKDSSNSSANELVWKPELGNDRVDLVSNPVQCQLSSTSKPFEFRLQHQYVRSSAAAATKSALKASGRKDTSGNFTLRLASMGSSKTNHGNKLSIWRHRQGATVFDGVFDRYTMEDGREMFFFHQHTLHEQEAPAPKPQRTPHALSDIGLARWWRDPPPPRIHDDATMEIKMKRGEISLLEPKKMILQTDVITFLVGKDVPTPMTIETEKPPYLPPVFLLRCATSDSQSLYNFCYDAKQMKLKQKSFDIDWQRIVENNYLLHKFMSKYELDEEAGRTMLENLRVAVEKNYGYLLPLFTYYSAMGDCTIRGIQLNAFRAFLQDTKICKFLVKFFLLFLPC